MSAHLPAEHLVSGIVFAFADLLGGAGYVTRFKVRRSFLDQYEVHQAGGKTILEYWIPAADLPAQNAAIAGTVEVTAEYH